MKKYSGTTIGHHQLIKKRAKAAAAKGNFFEAQLLMQAVIEFWLRMYLFLDKGLPNKYWQNAEIKFSTLIDYCEITGFNEEAIRLLRTYNKKRNILVHDCMGLLQTDVPPPHLATGSLNDAFIDAEAKEAYILAHSFCEKLDEWFK